MTCCDNPNQLYDTDTENLICRNCYKICEDYNDIYPPPCTEHYSPKYKRRHHLTEVLKRIECDEPNKPDIETIKPLLNGDYSLSNIYKKLPKHKKHITYIYCELNRLDPPIITPIQKDIILSVFSNLISLYPRDKLPKYIYIIAAVCKKLDATEILPFLYIHKRNPEYDKMLSNLFI